jgi:hypothetical protein
MQQDDRIFAVVGACSVTAVALVAALIWLGSGITVDAPQRATVTVPQQRSLPTPEPSVPEALQVVEAGYSGDDDDKLFRAAVARLSTHPELASYLVNDRLLRRFVRAVDAIAGGYSPAEEVEFLRPIRPFIVREDEGRLVIASGTYRRYDVVTDVFTSIDCEGAIEIYRRFRPRLETIYREVGWANDDFDTRLREAVDHLLEVTPSSSQVEVEQRAIVYAFAEDRFENLTGAQKQLLRMGPENVGAIQAKLRTLRDAIGWEAPLPAVVTAELEQSAEDAVLATPVIAEAAPELSAEPIVEHTVADELP